jgi:hypothetical protein
MGGGGGLGLIEGRYSGLAIIFVELAVTLHKNKSTGYWR